MVIAVVGLGYVGLPLAVAFGNVYRTIGFDISANKIAHFLRGEDPSRQVEYDEFSKSEGLSFSSDPESLAEADVIIIVVPTPIDIAKRPDLTSLTSASEIVGQNMKQGVLIIFESTVYPGLTEEVCVPILAEHSKLKWKTDFNVGYSPERVNPNDKDHTIQNVAKIVSGDCVETTNKLADIYGQIIKAEIFKASSIMVAEAAKVIENTQRDLNIALINELSIIFNLMGLDTKEVIAAAATKWNFIPFYPGLVGGHCIGVDPYYLLYKAEKLGYHPQVITAGRRINDNMAAFVAQQTVKQMTSVNINVASSRVLVLGVTFKENCSDMRNSKVADIVREMREYGSEVFVDDPVALPNEVLEAYGVASLKPPEISACDVVIMAVPHQIYLDKTLAVVLENLRPEGLFVDVKAAYSKEQTQKIGFHYWSL